MTDTSPPAGLQASGTVRIGLNPASAPGPGLPRFAGVTVKAVLHRDGSPSVSITGFATYGDPVREVSVPIDLDQDDLAALSAALASIAERFRERASARAVLAAMQAWQYAVRTGEMQP